MVTKTSAAPALDPAAFSSPVTLWNELQRRQLALASQSAAALLRSSQAMRQVQQQTAQRALAQQQQFSQRLQQPIAPAELMELQSGLLRYYVEEGATYWRTLAATAMTAQQDLMAGAASIPDSGAEPTLDELQRVFEATLDPTAPASPTH